MNSGCRRRTHLYQYWAPQRMARSSAITIARRIGRDGFSHLNGKGQRGPSISLSGVQANMLMATVSLVCAVRVMRLPVGLGSIDPPDH